MTTLSRILVVFALVTCALPWSTSNAQNAALGFVVIVNRTNNIRSLPRTEVARMFMKQVQRWSSGQAVQPVDLAATSSVREAFSRRVHSRSATSVASFWRQQIFSGRGVPPPEQSSDADVIRFVTAHAGAIGYVAPSANVTTVGVLEVSGL